MLRQFVILLMLFLSFEAVARQPLPKPGQWQCRSLDSYGHVWFWNNFSKDQAVRNAFKACEKNSRHPGTCRVAVNWCNFNELPQRRAATLQNDKIPTPQSNKATKASKPAAKPSDITQSP